MTTTIWPPAQPKTFVITRNKAGQISVHLSNNQSRPLGFHSNPFGGLEYALACTDRESLTPEYCKSVFDLHDSGWTGKI